MEVKMRILATASILFATWFGTAAAAPLPDYAGNVTKGAGTGDPATARSA